MADFTSVLNQPIGSVERPKILPPGNYIATVVETPKLVEVGKDKLPTVQFLLKVLQPVGEVDMEAFQAAMASSNNGVVLNHKRFVQTQQGQFALQEMLKAVFDAPEGMVFGEALAQCVGKQVIATVKHTPSTDGKQLYANVDDMAKAA